ncbi:MAG: hypothetical protein E5X03_29715 [Mesorhizobium sp.]|nr:MAG: hypothetical protein E5X03_29715 [Mesorhizobium sp.]
MAGDGVLSRLPAPSRDFLGPVSLLPYWKTGFSTAIGGGFGGCFSGTGGFSTFCSGGFSAFGSGGFSALSSFGCGAGGGFGLGCSGGGTSATLTGCSSSGCWAGLGKV